MRPPDWQSDDGAIRLYCGDCLELLPTLEAGSVDAVVTDPPYGISLSNHSAGKERRDRNWTIAGDSDSSIGNAVIEWGDNLGLCIVAFASPSRPWPGKWRSRLVWHKHGLGMGGDKNVCWKTDWELIQVKNNGPLRGSRESSVLTGFDIRPSEFEFHPCQKPVALLEYLIGKIPARTILDPFMGSGTTGVACVQTGRRFIGMEISEEYFAIAVKRITAAIEQRAGGPMFKHIPDPKLFEVTA